MDIDVLKQLKNNIFVFGPVGSCKTTLLNRLTGKKFETAGNGYSCTREIQWAITKADIGSFILIDFPGTNSAKDTMKHIEIQKHALKMIPFRAVIINMAWSTRWDDLINEFTPIYRIFRHHLKNIAIFISKTESVSWVNWDELTFVLSQQYKIDRDRIYRSNFDISDREYGKILSELSQELELVEEGIFETTSLLATLKDTTSDFSIIETRNKYEEKFKETYSAHLETYNDATDKELRRALYFSVKDEKEKILKEYSKEVASLFVDKWDFQAELIIFQNVIFNMVDTLRTLVQKDIVVETNYYESENLNRFKKCAYCGLIWFKVYGCNSMKCGNRTLGKDVGTQSYYNYFFSFLPGQKKLKWERKEKTKSSLGFRDTERFGLSEDEKKQNENRGSVEARSVDGKTIYVEVKKITPLGCGKTLDWANLIDVTDEITQKLQDVGDVIVTDAKEIALQSENRIKNLADDPTTQRAVQKVKEDTRKQQNQSNNSNNNNSTVAAVKYASIKEMLEGLNLANYLTKFEEQGFETIDELKDLTTEQLRDEIDIKPLAHRNKLLQYLKSLQ